MKASLNVGVAMFMIDSGEVAPGSGFGVDASAAPQERRAPREQERSDKYENRAHFLPVIGAQMDRPKNMNESHDDQTQAEHFLRVHLYQSP
jgi:hypothetical protein